MKYILTTLSILCFCFMAYGQGIEFIHEDLEEAKRLALKEDKIIFVDAYTTWCGPCKRLSKEVFPQKAAGDFYNANFINLKLDMEKGEGPAFGMKYKIRSYPTLLFITGEGELVTKSVGGRKVDQLIETGKTALKSFDFSADYAIAYEKGDRDFDLIYNYVKALNKSGKSSLKISNDYFRTNKNFTSEQNLKLLSIAATEADSKLFDRLIEHKSRIISMTSEDDVQKNIIRACANTAKKANTYESIDLLNEAMAKAKLHAPVASSEDQLSWLASYFNYVQDTPQFAQYMEEIGKDASPALRYTLGQISLKSYVESPEILNLAVDQVKMAIKSDKKNYAYKLLLAKIYQKQGDLDQAKKMATKALDLVKDSKGETQEINTFLESI